ncbi:MAG: class I SAM-dependent methyltransferase [Sedimentisphaerales bacterium]|nr:class I SAM-dependent methyltransferase [Sedimentisphaerales bacterium]
MTYKQSLEHFEEIYRESSPEEIPWNSQTPPALLVELLESGKVQCGRALDLGCGLGNYVIWLAGLGFDVIGIDGSPTAIKKAKRNAKMKNVKCRFLVADLTGDWPDLQKPFDFAYDWGLLHHISPEQRPGYVKNVHRALKPGGKYVSVCFNERDAAFKGTCKHRKTNMGTAVYLSSEQELRELFGRFFEIIDFRVLEIAGKFMKHVFNYCFMQKRKDPDNRCG